MHSDYSRVVERVNEFDHRLARLLPVRHAPATSPPPLAEEGRGESEEKERS